MEPRCGLPYGTPVWAALWNPGVRPARTHIDCWYPMTNDPIGMRGPTLGFHREWGSFYIFNYFYIF